MNAQNAKDYLPLVQALAEGKLQMAGGVCQINGITVHADWTDVWSADFKMPPEYYRIKPEPRHWWLNVHSGSTTTFCIPFASKEKADEWAIERSENPRLECVEVVEVVK